MAWIAVDVGTSVIKALAFDGAGKEIALARENSKVLRTNAGWAEQSMEAVWNAVSATVRSVVAELREPVEGIAVTAQGDGCWLVDAEGQPTGNAILWNDGRAGDVVEQWRANGVIEKAFEVSGSVPYAGLPNAILHWLHENQPERLAAARYALTCNGWIFSRMTGRFVADLSDASNPFGDVKAGVYSSALIELYGANPDRDLLPSIARGEDLVAPLMSSAAEEFGLAVGTPVVMTPYDIVSTAYGAGVTEPGQACVILGTTICAETITPELDLSVAPSGTTIALGDGLHLRAMPTLTGCETLEWAVQMLGVPDMAALEMLAASAEQGAGGVAFLPYLSPAGERAPFLEPRARGSLHGLSLAHSRAHVARAIYEGLTFAIRECLETATASVGEVRVCGGGARSGLWCQMIADVTGVQVVRPAENELGARGAFLFALKTAAKLESLAEGTRQYPVKMDVFEPSAVAHAIYEKQFRLFLEVRENARVGWTPREVGA
jgi:erythritol kinase (D-erythritol 1-phosphate-forming)